MRLFILSDRPWMTASHPHNCALDVVVLVYNKCLSCHFQERRKGRLFYGPQWLWEPKTQQSDVES